MEQSEIMNLTVGGSDMALLVGWDSEEIVSQRSSYWEVH